MKIYNNHQSLWGFCMLMLLMTNLSIANNNPTSLCSNSEDITTCNGVQIAHWNLNACNSGSSYSEFTASTSAPSGFSSVNASILSHAGNHSCSNGSSGAGICASARIDCGWQDDSADAFKFSITLNPSAGNSANLTKLAFYEVAPLNYLWVGGESGDNDPPSKYGIRVTKNGQEIYESINNATTQSWSLEEFDFTNDPDFTVTSQTTFSFELTGYCRSNGSEGYSLWDLDEIKVYGCAATVNPTPSLTINDVTVNENAGTATLQVCLSSPSSQTVTAQYNTSNGSAVLGADYNSTSGTVSIPAGQTCASVMVPIINDNNPEPTETFNVNLSNPSNATIADPMGMVTIIDNDQAPACSVTTGNCSITINGGTSSDYFKVFTSTWQLVWECNPWNGGCNSVSTITNLSNGTYYVQACGSTTAYTVSGCTTNPCATQGGDSDGDGVCNNQDCQPNNAAFPATPGTPCNDGNPNTTNDVVTSNGCGCAGTPVNLCINQGGDSDGDGVCNFQDCQPNNAAFPATPGTPCNDGNPNTTNDVVTSNGCGCAGTPVGPTCTVTTGNCSITINGGTSGDYFKVFTSTWQLVWECNPWNGGCNSVSTITNLSNGTYYVQACGSTTAYTVSGCTTNPCATQGGDSDGDGVCNNQDCQPNNPAFPATPGTPCNDGNPNTTNDVVTSNGCGCAGTPVNPCVNQGGDSDGDGVCNNQDCQPNNPAFPATPETPCNDGNPNTTNDVVTSNGCGCAGTPVGPTCTVTTGNCSITINGGTSGDYFKVFNSTWQLVWECNPWNGGCNSVSTITNLSNGTYYVQACGSTSAYTVSGCTTNPCATQGGDSDGDGVCNNQDCQPNNPAFPATPGTSCNDGNPNTTNDVVTSNGCGCAGTPVNPCVNQGGDSDGDGVCNNQDCQPNNPAFPATPGTPCNDGNPNTTNDVVTSNGCGCAGTPVGPTCTVTTNGCSIIITGGTSADYFKVFNTNWQIVWECNPWNGGCSSTNTITANLSNGTYYVQACGSVQTVTVSGCTTNPCATQGGDTDGDGVCNNQDCQPFNPAFPATPGTPCNDGNPNTTNDVVTSNGCACAGTPVNPCVNLGGDTDGDGVCNNQDCQPFNPAFPATPGTPCNDGNPNTTNDVVSSNGCACAGTPVGPCATQGGDSDGDGVCNNQDCQPNNPAFPATPGTPCNDNNANTFNDVVASNGCNCAGTPITPQTCDCDGAKIAEVYMLYNGSPCSAGNNSQSGKATCSGSIGSTTNTLIKVGSSAGGSQWFTGTLSVGETFTIKASNGGASKLGSDSYYTIGGQTGKFHTSCSQPIGVGNQFGGMLILGIKFDDGAICGTLGDGGGGPNPQPCVCDGHKINGIRMLYNGQSCSAGNNPQSGKATCSGSIGSTTNTLIKVGKTAGGSDWFSGTLSQGQAFTILSSNGGASRLSSDSYYTIGGQTGKFHTSCSKPIGVGDQFGGMLILGISYDDGDVCGDMNGTTAPLEGQQSESLYFTAQKDGRDVQLSWVTNTDYKNDYFLVEHAVDGDNFEVINEVAKISDSEEHIVYQDLDKNPNQGMNYYRLIQVFQDGTYRYSEIRAVAFDLDVNKFVIYPNPTADDFYVNLKDFAGNSGTLSIHNSLGQTVYTQQLEAITADPIRITTSDLAPGVHAVTVQLADQKTMTELLIVTKR